jgi:hypothetical protein
MCNDSTIQNVKIYKVRDGRKRLINLVYSVWGVPIGLCPLLLLQSGFQTTREGHLVGHKTNCDQSYQPYRAIPHIGYPYTNLVGMTGIRSHLKQLQLDLPSILAITIHLRWLQMELSLDL